MENYINNPELCTKPKILKEIEEAKIDLNELNYGLSNVFDPLTNEDLHWLSSPEYEMKDYFIKFAYANASGSEYCFFVVDKEKVLENQPIVIFGDEGQVNLVAKDFNDWLRLMTIGDEAFLGYAIDDVFYSEEEMDDNEHKLNLRTFLKAKNFELYDYNVEDASFAFTRKIIEDAQVYANQFIEVLKCFDYDHKDYEGL